MVYLRLLKDYSPSIGLVAGRVERFNPIIAARLIKDGIAVPADRQEDKGFDEPPFDKQVKAAPRHK